MTIRNKRLRAILCIIMLAAVMITVMIFAAHTLEHHCTEADCPVCAQAIHLGDALRCIWMLCLLGTICWGTGLTVTGFRYRPVDILAMETPVSLRVKLLN